MSRTKTEELLSLIWKLANALKGVMYVRNIPYAVTRLMFLKYVLDNYICANTVEAMQYYADAQKMLALKDVEGGLEAIWPVMKNIDLAYGLGPILSSNSNMAEYGTALFGGDYISKKRNLSEDSYKSVLSVLSECDLTDRDDQRILGRLLADALIRTIMDHSPRDSFRAEMATNRKLNNIAKQILDVKAADTFCDFASGLGISTIDITGDAMPKLMLAEINESVAALSVMLMILYGYKDICIKCIDTLVQPADAIRGNKLFIDPPIGIKVKERHASEYLDSTLIAIDMAVNKHLEDDGLAVITVPGRFLFAKDPQTVKAREALIKSGYLRAVVALPPMWNGAGATTNLLVVEKQFSQEREIVFVDAFRPKAKDLSDSDISGIVRMIKEPENADGLSYVSTENEVIAKGYDLLPAKYVPELVGEEETMTLEEIDSELSHLYGQLMGNHNV